MTPYILTGALRIVRDELAALLTAGEKPSVGALARRTGYTEQTVRRALVNLHEMEIIKYQCYRRGCRATYEVLQ